MRNLHRRILLCAAALSLATGPAVAAEPVLLGVVLPFSGPAAAYGAEARQGAELAVAEINDAGGILGGRKLQLVLEDDKGSPQTGVAAMQKLMSVNKVSVVVAGMSSPVTLAQTSIARNKILYMNIASQADAITEQGNPWLFQMNNTVSMNARAFNKYVTESVKPKTVAFVGENSEYVKPLLELIKASLAGAKIELVNVSLYDGDTRDFTSILTKIKSLDPDLLYVADGVPARASQLWKQVRQIGGFRREAMAPGLVTPGVLKASDGALEGVITGDIFVPTEGSKETQAFVAAYRKKFNSEPGRIQLIAYEAIKVIAGGMDKARSDTDYDKVSRAIRENTWNTPRGGLKFDVKGRTNAPYFYIQRVKGGDLGLLERVAG